MAELFENMEKLDIQAERRNTEEQRQIAQEQRQRAEEQRQRAEEQRQRAEIAEQNLAVEEQIAEKTIKLLIESYQTAGMTQEASCENLVEKIGLSEEIARAKIGCYWTV